MTTEAQRNARRQNGAKSRGPVTPEGKAVSRMNALKHGIFAEVTVVDFENEDALIAFGKRLRGELAPVGELELMLADRAVSLAWRLRRLTKAESEMIEHAVAGTSYSERALRMAFVGTTGDQFLRLSQYEAKLDRQLVRTLHELERLQERRRGGNVPAPLALDVTMSDPGTVPADVGSFFENSEMTGAHRQTPECHDLPAVSALYPPPAV